MFIFFTSTIVMQIEFKSLFQYWTQKHAQWEHPFHNTYTPIYSPGLNPKITQALFLSIFVQIQFRKTLTL